MNDFTVKAELAMFAAQSEHLNGLLKKASAQLRRGEDDEGIKSLLYAIAETEKLVENDQNAMQPHIDLAALLPAVKLLYFYIQNKDIAGIADFLEDTLCPLPGQWVKGCGNA